MSSEINPNTISDGDPIVIQDQAKNVACGIAHFDHEGRMVITAFKTQIPVARWSQRARDGQGAYATVAGIKIVGHEPPMELLAIDVIPKKKFGGSNPT